MWGSPVVLLPLRWFLLAVGLLILSAGLLTLVGCSEEDVSGHLTCVVYDDEVACDSQGCVAPDGGGVAEVPVEATQVVISSEASRFQPDGVYVYAELAAPEQALGVLELDVPRGGAGEPFVAYGEWRGTEQVFTATRTAGTIVVAPPGDRRGRFLLRLDDAGPDGTLGTADDLTRVLAAGEYGAISTAPLATDPLATPPPPNGDDGAVLIDVIDVVVDLGDLVSSLPDDGTSGDYGDGSGCGGEDVAESDSGCDGSGSSGGDASGCEGDTGGGGCEGGGGGGGCEGADTGGGGCEGGDVGGGCEGDYARDRVSPAGAATAPRAGSRPHARGPQRLAPLLLVGGVGMWCRRSGRRRRAG